MFYWWRQKRKMKRDPIGFIRQEFAFWGFDTSDMADEQLEKRLIESGKVIGSFGVSSEQAIRACEVMNRAMQNMQSTND